ncbi:hypothetical protein IGB42_04307 [Andreprevotia sp. IGB-42]|nr:hypothetical protein IGB42_04307 [Andreprevotia sp. IGB-42]
MKIVTIVEYQPMTKTIIDLLDGTITIIVDLDFLPGSKNHLIQSPIRRVTLSIQCIFHNKAGDIALRILADFQ